MSSQGEAYPEIPRGDLPVVTLAEVEDVALTEVAYSTNGVERQRENHFAEETSLFVPQQYILKQQFIIPNRVQGMVTMNRPSFHPALKHRMNRLPSNWSMH